MFELVERLTLRQRLARAADLARAQALTRAQHLRRAAAWLAAGVLLAIGALGAGATYLEPAAPPEVSVLEPARFRSDTLTVWRFRFAHRGGEASCFAVLYHDLQTWSVECP